MKIKIPFRLPEIKLPKFNNKENRKVIMRKKFSDRQIYLIYYYPPSIYVKPIGNKTLLNILLPYVYEYEVDGEKIKGILVFYGIPIHKKDLEELEKVNDKEKYYMYKALDFWTSLESLASYKGRMLFSVLSNPSGVQVSEVKASKSLPNVEINYYPFLAKAYELYTMLQEKNAVLLKSVQTAKTWKDVVITIFNNFTEAIIRLAHTNPRAFVVLLFTFIILGIMIYIFVLVGSLMGNVATVTKMLTNATVIKP